QAQYTGGPTRRARGEIGGRRRGSGQGVVGWHEEPTRFPHDAQRPRLFALIFLVSSSTCRYTLPLAAMSPSIFLMPCRAVVWSRSNFSPILMSERSVSSRRRYMAMCRAVVRGRDRLFDTRSVRSRPK